MSDDEREWLESEAVQLCVSLDAFELAIPIGRQMTWRHAFNDIGEPVRARLAQGYRDAICAWDWFMWIRSEAGLDLHVFEYRKTGERFVLNRSSDPEHSKPTTGWMAVRQVTNDDNEPYATAMEIAPLLDKFDWLE